MNERTHCLVFSGQAAVLCSDVIISSDRKDIWRVPQAEATGRAAQGKGRARGGAVRFFQAANSSRTQDFGGWWAFSLMEHAATNPGLITAGAESPLLSTAQTKQTSF